MSPAATSRATGAMARLRALTAVEHERLERRFDLDARLRSPASYVLLLERMLGFYRPLEERIAPFAAPIAGLGFADRRKAQRLVDDLEAVGAPRSAGPLPEATRLPSVTSADQALGVLYVLEGSTLGGALIAQQARLRLGVTPAIGASFFASYGPSVGSRWRAFGAVVETHTGGTPSPPMAAAAVACFADLEAWLCD